MADPAHRPVLSDPHGAPPTEGPLRPSNLSIAAVAFGVVAASAVWTLGLPALGFQVSHTTTELIQGIVNTLLQMVAAWALLRGARTLTGRRRVVWLLIGCGSLAGAIGSTLWSVVLALTGEHPQQPAVDLLVITALALTTIGVAALPPSPERSRRIRGVDTLIVMIAAVTVLWVTPIQQQIDTGSFANLATTSVVGAVTMMAIVMAVGSLARCRPGRQGEVGLMAGSLGASGLAALLYVTTDRGYPTSSRLADVFFALSFVLAAAAGLRLTSPPLPHRRRGGDPGQRWVALPEIATVVTLVGITVHEQRHDGSVVASFTVGIVAVGLALLRLAQLGREQRRLSRLLHDSADRLYREARTDTLTGLGNRLALDEHLRTRLERRARLPEAERSTLSVLFVDVDHFKRFNDALGHAVGDGLLNEVARRMTSVVGQHGYRIGGDEFVAVLEGLSSEEIDATAQQMIAAFERPVAVGDHEMSSNISVGVTSSSPDEDTTAADLLRRADLALYRAKELGRGCWCAYSTDLELRAEHRSQLRHGLRRAAGLGELEVRFQPVVDLRTYATVGVTTSLYWDSPEHGVLAPGDVSRIAAEGGLLAATVGALFGEIRATLFQTAQNCGTGGTAGGVPLWVGTRLTLAELVHPATTELIIACIDDPAVDPARLHVDITEDTVVDDAALEVIAGLRQLGVHVTVDRFGTGPSSLLRLSHYPATTIRVDGSFVEGLGRRHNDTAILTAVSGLAWDLGLELSADGIDEDFQATYLDGLGFGTGTGRLFGEAAHRSVVFDDEGRLRSSGRSLATEVTR